MGLITLGQDQRQQWDDFVARSAFGHTLQSWAWGEARRRTGWECVRLALIEDRGIQAEAQVLIRKLPYGLGKLAYIPRGPVLDYTNAALLGEMLGGLRQFAAREQVLAIKVEPEALEDPVLRNVLLHIGLVPASPVQMRSTIWIDLAMSEEELLASFKQKTRYNIRLASKRGVLVSRGTVEDLRGWYTMYEETARRDGFTIRSLDYYRTVVGELMQVNQAQILLAYHEGDLLAGIIVFAFGHSAQYMYGASSNQKRNLMAPYLLQWEGMRWAKARGAEKYDLWGIPDRLQENEDLWGVYRHKRGYGGRVVRYIGAFDIVASPWRHALLERVARPVFQRVSRGRRSEK